MFNAKMLQLSARLHVVTAKMTLPSVCEHVLMTTVAPLRVMCSMLHTVASFALCCVQCLGFVSCLILHIDDKCVDDVCSQQTVVLGCR